jgi:hypothetical protein
MKRLLATFGVLAAVWVLGGCSSNRSAGTSTETENAIVAISFSIDSTLAGLSAPQGSPVVATLRLDAARYDFSASRPDGQDLEVVESDGTPVPFEIVSWDPRSAYGRLRVRIAPTLRGNWSRIVVRSGLSPVPRQSPQEVWKAIPDSSRAAWTSIPVDDFESGNLLRNQLPDSSFWFLGGALPGSGITSAGLARSGLALRLVCGAGQCGSEPTILAATQLSRKVRNFRSLDSIELWIRGSGRLWVSMEHLDSLQMGRLSRGKIDSLEPRRAWTWRLADSAWRRITVRPSDFEPADGRSGNVGWPALRDSLNYVSVLLESGSEVWIDDFRLHGILEADLR